MELLLLGAVVGGFWWLFGNKKKASTSSSGGEGAEMSKEDTAFARQLARYQVAARGRGKPMSKDERKALRDYARVLGLKNIADRITVGEPATGPEVDAAVAVLKKRTK